MTKRFGFTLAEVLITLGIIGVVAAMTIPTLISNTNGAQFKTAYKKALSTLNQAVIMNIAIDDTDFSTLAVDATAGKDADGTIPNSMSAILKDRMQSATNITESYFKEFAGADGTTTYPTLTYTYEYTCSGNSDVNCKKEGEDAGFEADGTKISLDEDKAAGTGWAVFSFADGTTFAYNGAASNCSGINTTCIGFIDVNGSTGPNTPIDCDDAENGSCKSEEITDIYPVFFHGQTVEPANDSARAGNRYNTIFVGGLPDIVFRRIV